EPLSRITVGAMADLGYTVDYGGAEIYSPLWQNLAEPLDVDNSGLITLHDAVILVAFMRENGVGFSLPVPPTIPFVPELEAWYDVDSNEIVTINDSLLIISHLRNQQASSMAPSGQAAPLLATVQESFEAKLDELRDLSTTLDAAHRAQVDSQMPQFD